MYDLLEVGGLGIGICQLGVVGGLKVTAEDLEECLPEGPDEPIDGEIDGSVDDLKELDRGHDVDEPNRCDSLHGDLQTVD